MTAFLDKFTKTHRLSEFQKAMKSSRITQRRESPQMPEREAPGRPLPIEDTYAILKYGKKAWRALRQNGAVTYTPEGDPIVPYCGNQRR
jgi:hypothetical protein